MNIFQLFSAGVADQDMLKSMNGLMTVPLYLAGHAEINLN